MPSVTGFTVAPAGAGQWLHSARFAYVVAGALAVGSFAATQPLLVNTAFVVVILASFGKWFRREVSNWAGRLNKNEFTYVDNDRRDGTCYWGTA